MRKIISAFLALAFVVQVQADEVAPPRYKVIDIAASAGQKFNYLSAKAINNKGYIAGVTDKGAFLRQNGHFRFLGKLPGSESCEPVDVNDKGQIVGTCSFAHTNRGSFWPPKRYFFWQDGKIKDLGPTPEFFNSISINNPGQVALVGSSGSSLWENGRSKTLGSWLAAGINDKGQIIGAAFTMATGKKDQWFDRVWAVIWENGSAVSLGKNRSAALLINNNRNIVLSEDDGSDETKDERFFLLKEGVKVSLNSSGEYRFLKAINDDCQVVGWMHAASGQSYAATWHEGKWHNLNDLIPVNSGWVLKTAKDINRRGQIIGAGTFQGKPRAFLLTPL